MVWDFFPLTTVFLNLNFMATWCTNSEKLLVNMIFLIISRRQLFVIKRLVITIDVLRQTACLVVDPFNVNNFAYLSDCTTVGRASN